jgi:DNA-directed RNA polymerase specialized sigma24 family protein
MVDDARRASGSGGQPVGDDLLRQAYLLTGDPARAEGLVQRAVAAAAQHSRRTGPGGSDDVARTELVRAFVDEAGPGGHASEPLAPGRHAAAWTALGGLPARRRAVLVLRYGAGLSEEQIAARMGTTQRSVLADVEAGLLTLGPALNGDPDPGRLVSAALADAGRRWASGSPYRPPASRPAPSRDRATPSWDRATPSGKRPAPSWELAVSAAERVSSWAAVPSGGVSSAEDSGDGHDWWVRTGPPEGSPSRRDDRPQPGGQAQGSRSQDSRPQGGGQPQDSRPQGGQPQDSRPQGGGQPQDSRPQDSRPQNGQPQDGTPPPAGSGPTGLPHGSQRPAASPQPPQAPQPPQPTPARPGPVAERAGGADEPPFAAAAFPLGQPRPRRRFHTTAVIAAAALTTLVLGAAAVAVPALIGGDGDGSPATPAHGAAASEAAQIPAVPSRSVPKGLLDWPARGPLGDDEQVLTAATAAWRAKAPAAEAPAVAIGLLYAGQLDGRHVALVQALDKSGKPRVAQLSGHAPTAYRLVHAEPLKETAELLALMPPDGRGGRLRVLVSPEGQAAGGLLASDVSKVPLRKVPLNADGVSDILPSPPGIPTCSRVVLMGLPAPLGRTGPRVLESGVVIADMLGAMTMAVEVGSSTLAAGDNAVPQTVWFTDGELLAKKARLGKTTVTVASLGPQLPAQALSDRDSRTVESRAYELRQGTRKFVGSVVTLSGKTICTTVSPVGSGQPASLAAFALRCPLPGGSGTMGLLHVVGSADVQSVEVSLDPTRSPPGQAPYASSVARPASGATSGFAALDVVQSGFPCGAGTVQASGSVGTSPPIDLPVFTP